MINNYMALNHPIDLKFIELMFLLRKPATTSFVAARLNDLRHARWIRLAARRDSLAISMVGDDFLLVL
jgi:hypothetical protein